MGHVGIIAGLTAILLGLIIIYYLPKLSDLQSRSKRLLGGTLTILLGHAGAVYGALYLGTVGVILCYIAGMWILIHNLRRP